MLHVHGSSSTFTCMYVSHSTSAWKVRNTLYTKENIHSISKQNKIWTKSNRTEPNHTKPNQLHQHPTFGMWNLDASVLFSLIRKYYLNVRILFGTKKEPTWVESALSNWKRHIQLTALLFFGESVFCFYIFLTFAVPFWYPNTSWLMLMWFFNPKRTSMFHSVNIEHRARFSTFRRKNYGKTFYAH